LHLRGGTFCFFYFCINISLYVDTFMVLLMSRATERTIVVSTKPLRDYIIEVAVSFQEGAEVVVIKGYGKFISKAVDLYNIILNRMRDSIEYMGALIGSENVQGRSRPYIAIKIRKRY